LLLVDVRSNRPARLATTATSVPPTAPATAPASARWWGSSIWCRATTGMPARPLIPAWPPCGDPGAVAVRPRRLTSDVPFRRIIATTRSTTWRRAASTWSRT